jgi:hypothetical protein
VATYCLLYGSSVFRHKGAQLIVTLQFSSGLQNGSSGPFSDFLTKILGSDTPMFLCHTLFYFSSSLLLLGNLDLTPSRFFNQSVMGLEAITFIF